MNPLTYLRKRREAKKRKQAMICLLKYSGVIRHASIGIRYGMTSREIKKLLVQEDV